VPQVGETICQTTDFGPGLVSDQPSHVGASEQEGAVEFFVSPETVTENVKGEERQHIAVYALQKGPILQTPPVIAGTNIGQGNVVSDRPGEW